METRQKDKPPAPPVPTTAEPLPVGELPVQYRIGIAASAWQNNSRPPTSNRIYRLIPLIICVGLLWFAWIRWKDPPQFIQQPTIVEEFKKHRVWWMPDLMKVLPPFAEGYRDERFLLKYKMSSCSIHGNFPEINSAIFCYLLNSSLFTRANKTISQDLSSAGLCSKDAGFMLTDWQRWKSEITENPAIRRVAFIQHPLERFSRTFRSICQIEKKCFNCQQNLSCFMRKLIKEHQLLAEGLSGNIRTYVTNHFSPQTWNCNFNREFTRVVPVKIGGSQAELAVFSDNLNEILKEQGVPLEEQKIIKEEVMKIPLELSPEERNIMEKVRKDEDLFRLFRRLYEYDYIVFGYNF